MASFFLSPARLLYRSLYMMTHLHPPTSSSPLDLVREGFNLFVLGSDYQLGSSTTVSFSSFHPALLSLAHRRLLGIMRKDFRLQKGETERGKKGSGRRGGRKNVPSSALIENDRTEIWMTVGFVDVIEVGRLFAARQYISLSFFQLSAPLSSTPCKPFPLFEPVMAGHLIGSREAHTTTWDRERMMKEVHVHERVVSSCKIRPACRILKYDGEGG
jgi:hypothetical protein